MHVCPWSGTSDDPNCLQTLIAGDCTVFAHESFGLAWFLKISKHNVWVSQSILLQLLPMRTQNSNLPCASAFVRQGRTFHSINALRTFNRMHTFLNWRNVLSWIPIGSDLDPNRVCKCRERERERLVQAHQSKHSIGGSTIRERKRDVCMFFLNFVSFFYYGNSSTYFKVCVDLCKKSDRTRCLAVSIGRPFWFSEGRTK